MPSTKTSNAPWKVTPAESGGYVAHCEPLDLTVEGGSLDELAKAAVEAVEHFLAAAIEREGLDAVQERLGWDISEAPQFAVSEELVGDNLDEVRQFLDEHLEVVPVEPTAR